jgi:glycosyltransferase involved in cell wall biosynthesis
VAGNSYPQPIGRAPGSPPYLISYILTLNEEMNIAEAIRSVKAISKAVVIVDSGSQDRTVEIATAEGAIVWPREFKSEHEQRNWAADRIGAEWPGAWVLELDADERVSGELATEIVRTLHAGPSREAYLVTLRFLFDGRLLRFGGFSQTRVPRFRRAGAGRYEERDVNPHLILATRRPGLLKGHIVHGDVGSWERHIDKHNRYSSLEARARLSAVTQPKRRVGTVAALRSPHLRRRWMRERVWNLLPAKPIFLFINSYIVHCGFLDGRAGLRNVIFRCWQAMCTDLKYRELLGQFRLVEPPVSGAQRPPPMGSVKLVVCILTLNEEKNVADMIASARSVTHDVVIVDSFSTDATATIAADSGAQVWRHSFDSWGAQRNWALDRIQEEFNDPWVLFLDADERLSPQLVEEIPERLNRESAQYDAYVLRRTLIFAGHALRFGGFTGTQLARLLKSSAGRHEERPVNEHLILSPGTRVAWMRGRIIHHDVGDWERYLVKQNLYSTLEAKEVLKREAGVRSVTLREAITNPPLRRRWMRESVWPAIPAKPVVRFTQIYLLSGGVLDGYPGLCIATMQAWAEMCVELKADEFRIASPPPA